MATDQDQRPRYYEDQYLSADDLNDAVNFGRVQDARHVLGGHTWGISIGLEMVQKPWPSGNRVDMYITPGFAWDGYGRPIVALGPIKISEASFSEFRYDSNNSDHRDGKGQLIKVWLQYDERSLRPPARGFESCNEGNHDARIQETFRIVVGELGKSEQRGSVIIDGVPIDPSQSLSRYDQLSSSGPPSPGSPAAARSLYDESVPHQDFPTAESENTLPIWLVPIGYVRWLPVADSLGYFIQLDDKPDPLNPSKRPDSDLIRELRRYAGVVAESIEGAGGTIRLRDRFKDPAASHFTPPRITTDPNAPPENDLVWVEGDLRVVGDARLAGGKLALRTSEGKDEGVPLEIRRTVGSQGVQGSRALQVIIGLEGAIGNRLSVGCTKPDKSIDQKLVVTSNGNVGVRTESPRSALDVSTTTLSTHYGQNNQGQAVVGVFRGGAQEPSDNLARARFIIEGGTDQTSPSLDLRINDPGGNTRGTHLYYVPSNWGGNPEHFGIWTHGRGTAFAVHSSTNNIGVGTLSPVSKLQVAGDIAIEQRAYDVSGRALPAGGTMVWNDGTWLRLNQNLNWSKPIFGVHTPGVFAPGSLNVGGAGGWGDPGFGNIWATGTLGIGTTAPAGKIDVDETAAAVGSRLKIGHSTAGHAHHVTSFRDIVLNSNDGFYLRHNPIAGDPTIYTELVRITRFGDVGIGTTSPGYKLYVNGSAAKPGGGTWTNASDKRLKKSIEPLTGALERLTSLRGVVFEWKDPATQGNLTGKQIGLIAQEIEAVFPEWVGTDADGYKDLAIRGFEALTIESSKEIKKGLDDLRSEFKAVLERGKREEKDKIASKRHPKKPT